MAKKKNPWEQKPEFPRMVRSPFAWAPEDVDAHTLKMAREMTEAAVHQAGLGNVDIISWAKGYLEGLLAVHRWQGQTGKFQEIQDMIDWLGENESLLTKR